MLATKTSPSIAAASAPKSLQQLVAVLLDVNKTMSLAAIWDRRFSASR